MILNVQHWWQHTKTSFWFTPAMIVAVAVGLAAGLIALDTNVDIDLTDRWPLVFGSGAAGSRGLLTAVAGSMITVAGVVFSITIVALSLTSSQYTSRVLRNFMGDAMNQIVLGVFVGIFAYCLVVLRTIRDGEETAFVPSFAVLGGLALAFIGIGFLIFFIHHISISIQASSIIADAAEETIAAVDALFPDVMGEGTDDEVATNQLASLDQTHWTCVNAIKTGYIESVHADSLLAYATRHQCVVRMERGVGEFVIEGAPLLSVSGLNESVDLTNKLNALFIVSRHRTIEQDAGFGIRQIVDIALKALSPGVNDTTTAVMCVDYLAAILAKLASRRTPSAYRLDQGVLRVIARGPSFESLLSESLDQIRQNSQGNVAVLTRQLQVLDLIACQTKNYKRRGMLRQQAELISTVAQRTIASPYDGQVVMETARHVKESLERR